MDNSRIILLFGMGLGCIGAAWMLVWQLQPDGKKKDVTRWLLGGSRRA